MPAPELDAEAAPVSLEGVNVRGRFLTPGTFTLFVGGEPAEVTFTKEVILDAYQRLREDVKARRVEMRLSHPGTGDMPIRWGHVRAVAHDAARGDVWLTESAPLPEMVRLLTPEAVAKLQSLGLSFDGSILARPKHDAEGRRIPRAYEAQSLTVSAVDIVNRGAFDGSQISSLIPAGLAAKLAAANSPHSQQRSPGRRGPWVTAQGEAAMDDPTTTTIPPELLQAHPELAQLAPEQVAAYLAAYNEALQQGSAPEMAHAVALQRAAQPAAPAPTQARNPHEDNPMKPTEEELTKLRARAKQADDFEQQLKDAKAQLAQRDTNLADVTAKLAEVSTQVDQLKADREDALAREDVDWAITKACKASPAESASLLKLRKKVGSADFREHISARAPLPIRPGEMGAQPQTPTKDTPTEEAAKTLDKYGVDGIFQARLHEAGDSGPLRLEVAARHPTHPLVRRHLKAELKHLDAKAKKAGEA